MGPFISRHFSVSSLSRYSRMRWAVCVIFSVLVTESLCDNMTGKYLRERRQRLLSFNAQSGDIEVELDFTVPFLQVPVKRSLDYAKDSIANLNLGAVALAGTMTMVTVFFVPGLIHVLSQTFMPYLPKERGEEEQHTARSEDASWWRTVAHLEQTLLDHDIDSTTCMQRAVCWTVRNAAGKLRAGDASSGDKIIDGVATNAWFQYFLDGSTVQEALNTGLLPAGNCTKEYSCRITQMSLQTLLKKFATTINS